MRQKCFSKFVRKFPKKLFVDPYFFDFLSWRISLDAHYPIRVSSEGVGEISYVKHLDAMRVTRV